MTRIATLVLLLCAIIGACSDDGGDGPLGAREHGGEDIGGHVIATVDGVGITVTQVEAMVELTGRTPEEALALLEERELLAAEARRRGFDARRERDMAAARAGVQQLLAEEIEDVVTPASITDEAIALRYEQLSDRYRIPERRTSLHLLTRVPARADESVWRTAERHAAQVLRAALNASDPAAVLTQAAERAPPDPLTMHLEQLPAIADVGTLEAPYAEALFATPSGSVHPTTVRTSYGVHVVLVQTIEPPVHVSLDDVEAEIRDTLVLEGRAERLSEILERAAATRAVEVSDPAFARAAALEIDS